MILTELVMVGPGRLMVGHRPGSGYTTVQEINKLYPIQLYRIPYWFWDISTRGCHIITHTDLRS